MHMNADSRLLLAVRPGLGIALVSAFFLAICIIAGWITGRSFTLIALALVIFSLAAAAAITGIAAEYFPFSGRLWGFILGAGGMLMFFLVVMLWRSLATGDPLGTTQKAWAWLLGIFASSGILGSFCSPRSSESAQQTAARDRATSAAREQ